MDPGSGFRIQDARFRTNLEPNPKGNRIRGWGLLLHAEAEHLEVDVAVALQQAPKGAAV